MADTHETIADIVAEKRRRADELEASSYRPHQFLRERIAELRQEADRLEAARKRDTKELRVEIERLKEERNYSGVRERERLRANGFAIVPKEQLERGDAAKLRDALKAIVGLCAGLMPTWDGAVGRIKDIAETALAAPATSEKSSAVGNVAKLREALVKCRDIALQWQADEAAGVAGTTDKPHARSAAEAVVDMEFEINAALSAPPRNCDVGTAQEQDERFHRFCVKHHTGSCAGCHNPVGDYTVANGVRECALVWAQMPYEEGGAK